MIHANTARGEVAIKLAGRDLVLKPEHQRGPPLDAHLPGGVLGTLLRITEERDIRVRDLATIIWHLAEPRPENQEAIEDAIFEAGVMSVAGSVTSALAALAGGSSSSGEEVAPSGPAIG